MIVSKKDELVSQAFAFKCSLCRYGAADPAGTIAALRGAITGAKHAKPWLAQN